MLLQTAKALKQARRLQQEAMLMWALQQGRTTASDGRRHDRFEQQLADPTNRNWHILYRGSVLDD